MFDKFIDEKKNEIIEEISNLIKIPSVSEETGKQEKPFGEECEKALNYLMICDNEQREKVLCDIITSILTDEHIDNAEKLFKQFANLSETDISVIDFHDSLKTLETYCYADDKFLPQPFSEGDNE